jgi:hypothetical protein
MTLNGGTKTEKRPLGAVIFRVAAIIGIIGIVLYVATIFVVSYELLYSSYAVLALAAAIALGNGIVLLALKPEKA